MATFAKPYSYVLTPPRPKSTVTRKPAPKQVSIFDKLQHIKPNNAALSMPQQLMIIEATGLEFEKEGFATENRRPDNIAFGVSNATTEKRGGSLDSNEDPIILLGNDDLSASKVEVNNSGLYAKSAAHSSYGALNKELRRPIPCALLPPLPVPRASYCTTILVQQANVLSAPDPRPRCPILLVLANTGDKHKLVRPALNSDIFNGEDRQDKDYHNIEDSKQPQ
ncbi:hypothetical protein LAWI1_G002836 [Lachnellula willkommii]|uniref:Uncharacterized protein n=1 Tax=Lachnellula willkommii TaxID=215461 RepID=A0A559MDR0_9HELO|nr:hypothetical protein LAWI1_G002836 [Lachnellula willkommii]